MSERITSAHAHVEIVLDISNPVHAEALRRVCEVFCGPLAFARSLHVSEMARRAPSQEHRQAILEAETMLVVVVRSAALVRDLLRRAGVEVSREGEGRSRLELEVARATEERPAHLAWCVLINASDWEYGCLDMARVPRFVLSLLGVADPDRAMGLLRESSTLGKTPFP